MAINFRKKQIRRNSLLYTFLTAIVLCVVFLVMLGHLYTTAEEEAYENLHIQTKQIKDNITLQLISDNENLYSMANFAAKLYSDRENYDLMFQSFKPIGLIENIGILKSDNVFVSKVGEVDLSKLISFEEEAQKGAYISGRTSDVIRNDYEIIRSAMPVVVDGETVAILYGVIPLEKIGEKYNAMAEEFNAQLFVYEKATGDLVIDTVHEELGNISFLNDRQYNKGYSYEQVMATDKGFTSFLSAYKDENAYMHYSTMEEFGWMIAMARYESQVFAQTHNLINVLVIAFLVMIVTFACYIAILLHKEKQIRGISTCAADIRKTLLETGESNGHIDEGLMQLCLFIKARSVIFFNADGEEYSYTNFKRNKNPLSEAERKFFMAELFRYVDVFQQQNETSICVAHIKVNRRLKEENEAVYQLLKEHGIREVSFSGTTSNTNHTVVLALIEAKDGMLARMLTEKVNTCFSMALRNQNRYNKIKQTATTDALTGALNRVAYNNDLALFAEKTCDDFSCVYIDVNELHLHNNLYGHAAGDEMLVYIANVLKEVFYGHKIYRMGGDEFLVFCENTAQEVVSQSITLLQKRLERKNYCVSVGVSFRTQNTCTDEMVQEAERRMYENKSEYYQKKEQHVTSSVDEGYIQMKTGLPEIDQVLSVLTENYSGLYRVSLQTDHVKRILMPKAYNYGENETDFTKLFSKYVTEEVASVYHRTVMRFLNYDALKQQLIEGEVPQVSYKKYNGDKMRLSVYKLDETDDSVTDTLWVFANE